MRHTVEEYVHVPGRHCGSTALAGWFRRFGHPIDEAMAFGLGAGLGTIYLYNPNLSPTHMFLSRTAQLEVQAFNHLGIPNKDRTGNDPWEIFETNKRMIDRNIPVILTCDLAHLPYWNTKTHFNGHQITLVGYDDETKTVQIADTHFDGYQICTYEEFIQSRTANGPPGMDTKSNYHDPDPNAPLHSLGEAIPTALRRQADEMMNHPAGELAGVRGIRRMGNKIEKWKDAEDWSWCYRFTYQVIEKRGTGGAAFRKLYAEFLEQAESFTPAVKRLGLAGKMRIIEADWTRLADLFKDLSEGDRNAPTDDASEVLLQVAQNEESFYRAVLEDRQLGASGGENS